MAKAVHSMICMFECTVVGGAVTAITLRQHHANVRDDAIGAAFLAPATPLAPASGYVLSAGDKAGTVQAWADMCLAACTTAYGV